MRRSTIAAVALLAVVFALAACQPGGGGGGTGTETTTTPETTGTAEGTSAVLTAKFDALNGSGVTGDATVTIQGDSVMVSIEASGLVPSQQHPMHIHSIATTQSSCPPTETTGTIMREPDAEKYYGPVLVPLQPFPTASASGDVTYSAEVTGVPAEALPLAGRALVIHGLTVEGQYDPEIPVACALLQVVEGLPSAGETTPAPGAESTATTGGVEGTATSPTP